MGTGILGGVFNTIFGGGGQGPSVPGSNIFGPGEVGGLWGDYLKDLYRTPIDKTPQFRTQSTALRDALSLESNTQKDEFGLASNAGGFYDSGARLAGLNDINRSRLASYSQGLAQILSKLESDKMQAAFPFVSSFINEYQAQNQARYGSGGAGGLEQESTFGQIGSFIGNVFGGGSGSGAAGIGTLLGCWVAEAIFGKDSFQTDLARLYVNRIAPEEFRSWYLANGQELAQMVETDPRLKAVLEPLFIQFGMVALSHLRYLPTPSTSVGAIHGVA